MNRFTPLFLIWAILTSASLPGQHEHDKFAPPPNGILAEENVYYRTTFIPIPAEVVLEVGGILPLPGKRLAVCTRRGEVWLIDGAYEDNPQPRYTLFADGLHEALGLAPGPDGGIYVAQRVEITLLKDTDGDDRADVYQAVQRLPVWGSYHEYAFGPKVGPDGKLRVTLNVAFGVPSQSPVNYRGWMMESTANGGLRPIAAGLRSPAGFMVNSAGDWLFGENQGEWVGSGRVTHVEEGDFAGHPASLAWADLPGSPVKARPADIENFEAPMHTVLDRVPGLKLPAVWLPHGIVGISTSDIVENLTGAKFGPFAGQYFVGDQGQSLVNRMSLEKVDGVYQGAVYPFRVGFESGIIRLAWGEDGALFAGSTARGWGSVGAKDYALARVNWTGETPFEMQEVTATPDGFRIAFTQAVDPATAADPANYKLTSFTYLYHQTYGSDIVEQAPCPIAQVEVAADAMSVRLVVAGVRQYYIHEVQAAGVRSARNLSPLLHATAYYTLNRIPSGERLVSVADLQQLVEAKGKADAATAQRKHHGSPPVDWTGPEQMTLTISTLPGLRFDHTELTVTAGQQIKLNFINPDDMLHNWVLTAPGRGQEIGRLAMALGLDGMQMNWVPDNDAVITHTALVQPESQETIYFTAPTQPGRYDFICSFPGHAQVMYGTLVVLP